MHIPHMVSYHEQTSEMINSSGGLALHNGNLIAAFPYFYHFHLFLLYALPSRLDELYTLTFDYARTLPTLKYRDGQPLTRKLNTKSSQAVLDKEHYFLDSLLI